MIFIDSPFVLPTAAGYSEDSDYATDVNYPANGPSGSHVRNNTSRHQQQQQQQQQHHEQPYLDHNSQHDQYYYDTGQHPQVFWLEKNIEVHWDEFNQHFNAYWPQFTFIM